MQPLLDTVRRNASWMFAATAISGVINLLALAIFARALGSDAMGVYARVVISTEIVAALVGFGFNQVLIRDPDDANLRAAVLLATVLQTVTFLILSLLAYKIALEDAQWNSDGVSLTVLLIASARVLGWFSFVLDADFRAQLNYRPIALVQVIAATTGVIAGLAVLHQSGGIISIAIRDLLTSLVPFAAFLFLYKRPWSLRANSRALRLLWSYSRSLWILNALERISLRLDFALVGYTLGQESLGAYFAVRRAIDGVLNFFMAPIQTVLYSFYCRAANLPAVFRRILRTGPVAITLVLAAAGLAYLYSPVEAVTFVFGPTFAIGALIVPGLILYALSTLWFENTKAIAMAASVHGRTIAARVGQLVVLGVVTVPMAERWGMFGAGMATGIGALVLSVTATSLLSQRRTGLL